MKQHGRVEKIKLIAVDQGTTYDCYVLFSSHKFAVLAHKYLNGHSVNNKSLRTKLYNKENVNFGPQDFTPAELDPGKKIERNLPRAKWFVAEYKNSYNFMKATELIKWKIGNIPEKNIKRYGKAILIEADDDTRASLLSNFKPPVNGNVKSITPHRTFNLTKGIIHSRDLYEFSEEEILHRCPANIYKIQKLKGINNAILEFFSNRFLPEFITVSNVRLNVKKYRPNPKQCRNCLDYGHVKADCHNKEKCLNCSAECEGEHTCTNIKYCFHCTGNHGPTSRNCSRFRFEHDIVTLAEDEHISLGSAKRRVMGANKDPSSTYSLVVRKLKGNKFEWRQNPVDHSNSNLPPRQSYKKNDQQKPQVSTSALTPCKPQTEKQTTSETDKSNPVEVQVDIHNSSQPSSSTSVSAPLGNSMKDPKLPSNMGANTGLSVKPKPKPSFKDGFWSPPKNKRGRQSPPHQFEIKTSNPFEILDPLGPLSDPRPLKKNCHFIILLRYQSNNN